MIDVDRETFLKRLSVLSVAAVAGCGGSGGLLSPANPVGTDGAMLPGGATLRRHTDGSTTYSFSNGAELVIGATSGNSFTSATLLNGVQQATMTTSLDASSGILTFTGSQINGSIALNLATQGANPWRVGGYTATAGSDGATATVVGPSVSGSATTTLTSAEVTSSSLLNGASYSSSKTFNTTGGGGGCHACPQVGVGGGLQPALDGWNGVGVWLGAAGIIVGYIGLVIGVIMASPIAIVVGVIGLIIALGSFIASML